MKWYKVLSVTHGDTVCDIRTDTQCTGDMYKMKSTDKSIPLNNHNGWGIDACLVCRMSSIQIPAQKRKKIFEII